MRGRLGPIAVIAGSVALAPAFGDVPAAAPTLSVLTYNIEGVPFPFARGRDKAAAEIAAQLKAMRETGDQPHVVVLQEAFGKAQKSIGTIAGYRYIAFGPGKRVQSEEQMDDADRAFRRGAKFSKGETLGKWRGSGLAILSDYPIVSVSRAAFPAWACAGSDCMVNKGVLLANVAVPGVGTPVAVVATHLNSKRISGVPQERFNGAYQMQVRTIARFLKANLAPETPYILAGDTNIGKSVERRAMLEKMLADLPRATDGGQVRTALSTCLGAAGSCTLASEKDAQFALRYNKDWQVYGAGATTSLRPFAIAVPFGHDATGRMLSDHVGYTALYSLNTERGPMETVALR